MAEESNRYSDNVTGPWYVDTACIGCDLCQEYAPDVFESALERDHSLVFHQPITPEELKSAEEARQNCPVDAIGNDG